MNKLVIYTSIVGSYDELLQPQSYDSDFDYICFVKEGTKTEDFNGVWQIKEIPFNNSDNRVLSRFPKINPHLLLPEYEYSFWIDGNVTINSPIIYDILKCKIRENVIYSGVKHWGRDCAYSEIFACINAEKENIRNGIILLKYFIQNDFPIHYGLYENNVIFRKHNDPKIKEFDTLWWNHYMKFSKRDQLTHSFCYWKNHLSYDYILPQNYCTRNTSLFIYVKHVDNKDLSKMSILRRKFKVMIVKFWYLLYSS